MVRFTQMLFSKDYDHGYGVSQAALAEAAKARILWQP